MAERRMFAKTIIDSDAFLDMPLSTQALYFHLSMRADDEGFVNNPKKIARMIGADDDSLRILFSKQYLIPFESGVVVIKHWKIHNYIRGDRLTETAYKQEKSMLSIDENGAYSILDDIREIQALDSGDKRKLAYQNSTLPYSFTYKMKRAFEGKTCPMCGCKMSSSNKRTMPTIQHNKPISDGGEHELHNISVICLSCNTSIQNQETGELNNSEVIEMWDRIVYADKHKIKWFFDLSLLEDVYKQGMSDVCQTSDGQVTDKCLTQDRLGKDRLELGKDKEKKERKTSFDDAISEYTSNDELKETIIDFIKMRKLIKAPMTDRALKGIFKELDKLGHNDEEKIAILEQSIERSWRGVFAISKPKQEPKQEQENDDGVLDLNKMYEEQWANIDDSIFGGK